MNSSRNKFNLHLLHITLPARSLTTSTSHYSKCPLNELANMVTANPKLVIANGPCQRCVMRGKKCEYLGDATPTLLFSTPQPRHVQHASHLQRSDAPDLVAETFPGKSANVNENRMSDRTTLPVIAGPKTSGRGITTHSASRSSTPQHQREYENNTLNMETVMADNTSLNARPCDVQEQPDESSGPIFKQHHNNGSNVMKSGEQDSKHELEDKLDSLNHCRPCKL
jgi:hypothetical protein